VKKWKGMMVVVLMMGGCQATHVVYVHDAVLGIDVSPVPSQGTMKFVLGYDRETFALVPRHTEGETNKGEAMSVTGVSRVKVTGMHDVTFGHVIATGKPAVGVAKDGSGLKDVAERLFEKGGK